MTKAVARPDLVPARGGGPKDGLRRAAGLIFLPIAQGVTHSMPWLHLPPWRFRDQKWPLIATKKFWNYPEKLERAMGFEPTTPTLARLCSTPELRPRSDRALFKHPPAGLQAGRGAICIVRAWVAI
jgi:hypothetical protein